MFRITVIAIMSALILLIAEGCSKKERESSDEIIRPKPAPSSPRYDLKYGIPIPDFREPKIKKHVLKPMYGVDIPINIRE